MITADLHPRTPARAAATRIEAIVVTVNEHCVAVTAADAEQQRGSRMSFFRPLRKRCCRR